MMEGKSFYNVLLARFARPRGRCKTCLGGVFSVRLIPCYVPLHLGNWSPWEQTLTPGVVWRNVIPPGFLCVLRVFVLHTCLFYFAPNVPHMQSFGGNKRRRGRVWLVWHKGVQTLTSLCMWVAERKSCPALAYELAALAESGMKRQIREGGRKRRSWNWNK